MDQELETLVETLQEVAFEAGCALLDPAAAEALAPSLVRFRYACLRLRLFLPSAACLRVLPTGTSPGALRLAARDVVAFVERMHTQSQCQRSAA